MKPKKLKRSTLLPVLLLVYLGIMAYIGRGELYAGNYAYYFTIIGLTLFFIFLLHIFLKKREKLQANRNRRQENES